MLVLALVRKSPGSSREAVRPLQLLVLNVPAAVSPGLKEMERVVFKLQCRDQCGFTTPVVPTADTESEPSLVPAINSCASDNIVVGPDGCDRPRPPFALSCGLARPTSKSFV
jgi:hypothetical protein